MFFLYYTSKNYLPLKHVLRNKYNTFLRILPSKNFTRVIIRTIYISLSSKKKCGDEKKHQKPHVYLEGYLLLPQSFTVNTKSSVLRKLNLNS